MFAILLAVNLLTADEFKVPDTWKSLAEAKVKESEAAVAKAKEDVAFAQAGMVVKIDPTTKKAFTQPVVREIKGKKVLLFPDKTTMDKEIKSLGDKAKIAETLLAEAKAKEWLAPKVDIDKVKVGDTGTISYPTNVVGLGGQPVRPKIVQIVDEANAITEIYGQTFWLQIPTEGLVDGKTIILDFPCKVAGTKKYTTTDGGSKTVFLIAPLRIAKP